MKLEKLINECIEALQEEAGQDYAYLEESEPFGATINTNDGYIDLWYNKGDVEVVVVHDWDMDADHPRYGESSVNLEKFLSEKLYDCVDWNAIKDEWRDNYMDEYQRNGFRDATDFWHWKEGR